MDTTNKLVLNAWCIIKLHKRLGSSYEVIVIEIKHSSNNA